MMTSFLDVIANDENDKRRIARKAAVLSQTRITNRFGSFIEARGDSAIDYLEEEIATVVAGACEEVGEENVEATLATVVQSIKSTPPAFKKEDGKEDEEEEDEAPEEEGDSVRTASIHEARKPKMCPYHKDVVDISLASSDPRAGFDSMSSHWGGPRHCEGEGYEGGSCKFKAPMVTQSYWDEKQQKAEEKRQQRLEQAEHEIAPSPTEDIPSEPVAEAAPVDTIDAEPQGAEVIDFPSEPSAVGEGIDTTPEALAVAAKTADATTGDRGAYNERFGPKTCEACEDGDHCNSGNCSCCAKEEKESSTKTADDTTGLGGPVPKIDKRKWTPQTVKEIPLEGDESRNPTTRTDIAAEGYDNSGDPTGIGENKTERVKLPSSDNAGFSDGGETGDGQGGTWTKGPATAVSSVTANDIQALIQKYVAQGIPYDKAAQLAQQQQQVGPLPTGLGAGNAPPTQPSNLQIQGAHDVDKNELVEIMRSNYDGFLPQAEVQKAVVAHRRA